MAVVPSTRPLSAAQAPTIARPSRWARILAFIRRHAGGGVITYDALKQTTMPDNRRR